MPRGIFKNGNSSLFKKGHHPKNEFKKGNQFAKGRKNKPNQGFQKGFHPNNEFKNGNIPWHKGKKCFQLSGENNPNWKGGLSYEPYTIDWTIDLKRAIRKRDKYTCQVCGKEPAVYVHHKDYDKKNCNQDNLITLCHSCHGKTNGNRNYWIKYFRKLLKISNLNK